jgi:hypothetical protein
MGTMDANGIKKKTTSKSYFNSKSETIKIKDITLNASEDDAIFLRHGIIYRAHNKEHI